MIYGNVVIDHDRVDLLDTIHRMGQEVFSLRADIERLRGLLRDIEVRARRIREDKAVVGVEASYIERIAALAGAAVQPSALPERCSVCGGAHDVGNPCRATSPTPAPQPQCACEYYWPGQGHHPDCPTRATNPTDAAP